MPSKERILITGASGFLGGTIAAELKKSNFREVTELVGISSTSKKHQFDLSSPLFAEKVYASLHRCDVIIHCASSLTSDLSNQNTCLVNCLGTHSVLRLAKMWKVRQVIYLSGVSVVGKPIYIPIDENHPCAAANAYLSSKLYGEHLHTLFSRESGIPITILRLTAPIGERMPSLRLIPTLLRACFNDETMYLHGTGSRVQNYVDSRDICSAVKSAIEISPDGIFNIGSETSISNIELAKLIRRLTGSSSPIVFTGREDAQDEEKWIVSIAKAQKYLEYNPQFNISSTIQNLASYVD